MKREEEILMTKLLLLSQGSDRPFVVFLLNLLRAIRRRKSVNFQAGFISIKIKDSKAARHILNLLDGLHDQMNEIKQETLEALLEYFQNR